jgi:hypothetical protein
MSYPSNQVTVDSLQTRHRKTNNINIGRSVNNRDYIPGPL